MKKELSPAMIRGLIGGVLAVIGVAIFLLLRSDPASQAPNPPPRFDPAVHAAAEQHFRGAGTPKPTGSNPAPSH